MLRAIMHINFMDFAEAMPCFVTMLMMPFTASEVYSSIIITSV